MKSIIRTKIGVLTHKIGVTSHKSKCYKTQNRCCKSQKVGVFNTLSRCFKIKVGVLKIK